jgi:pimeloyl-ACP methyl ester carboxylesterase
LACGFLGCDDGSSARERSTQTDAPVTGETGGASEDGGTDGGAYPLGADYRAKGRHAVARAVSRFEGESCSVEVESFAPDQAESDAIVVMAPGFALFAGAGSTREAMSPLAEHLASWGVTTYTAALCTNGSGIDHELNGRTLAELGENLGPSGAVYVGFSAGGLAAMIAAAEAQNTRGYLALDAVDSAALAAKALERITAPRFALVGEPSDCNDNNNMLSAYEGRPVRAVRVTGAQHFIFEGDVCAGVKCLVCDGGGPEQVELVRALSAAFARHVLALDRDALTWWDAEGSRFRELEAAGRLVSLQ